MRRRAISVLCVLVVGLTVLAALPAPAHAYSVQVVEPDGGEAWSYGQTYTIRWNTDIPLQKDTTTVWVNLYLSVDGGVIWETIASGRPNTKSYSWTIPSLPSLVSKHCRVKVEIRRLTPAGAWTGISPADFAIKAAVAPPAAPSGLTGTAVTRNLIRLQWEDNSANETGFHIYWEESGGATNTITVSANTTTYDHVVISAQGYHYVATAFNAAGESGPSNEINVGTHWAQVTSPNGGEVWLAGQTHEVTWNSSILDGAGSVVNLKYSIDAGETWVSIDVESILPNTGSYSWSVPAGFPSESDVKVRVDLIVTAGGGSGVFTDTSDACFSILQELPAPPIEPPPVEPPPIEPPPPAPDGKTTLWFYIDSAEYFVQRPSDSSRRLQTMDAVPVIVSSRTMLPIRCVAEQLGAGVAWDGHTSKVTVTLGPKVLCLWIGNPIATVNGINQLIDPLSPTLAPLIMPPGRTMLPLRFITENLGCDVGWEPSTREVRVTYPAEE